MKRFVFFLFLFLGAASLRGQVVPVKASDTVICTGTRVTFTVTDKDALWWHYRWSINGKTVGGDSIRYISDTLQHNDTVVCKQVSAAGDVVIATSRSIVMRVDTVIPSPGIISGPDKVCPGDSIVLSPSVPGGVWMSSSKHSSVTAGTVIGIVEGAFECTYDVDDSVFYVVSAGMCSDTTSYKYKVMRRPSPWGDLPNTSYCMDIPYSRTSWVQFSCFDYSYYVTTDSNKYRRLIDVFCVSSTYCGTDTFKINRKIGLYYPLSDTAHFFVSDTTLCIGERTRVIPDSGQFSHRWTSSSGLGSVSAQSGILYYNGVHAGRDTLTLRLYNVCGYSYTRPDQVYIDISPRASTVADYFGGCIGKTIQLTDTVTIGYWLSSNASVAVVDSMTGLVTGIAAGDVKITHVLPFGCNGDQNVSFSDCSTEVQVFPVPADAYLVVRLPDEAPFRTCTITDVFGRQKGVYALKGIFTFIDTSDFLPGAYFLTLDALSGQRVVSFSKL